MDIQSILALVGTALPLLTGLVTFIVKFVKNEKVKKVLQQTVKITEALQPLIIRAEAFTHYTGEEKKQFVLTAANRFAIENGISFDAERVSALIDELVVTTKKVNAREKDAAAADIGSAAL